MKYKVIFALLACLTFTRAVAQGVRIVVPVATDTVVCDGEPLTLRAINEGYPSRPTGLNCDDCFATSAYPIGFSFNFYGTTYTQFVPGSNGFITFNTSAAGAYCPWSITTGIPGNTGARNSVMGIYSDINMATGGGSITYGTFGTAPNRRLVVNWCDTRLYSCGTIESFQIMLYETTNIAEVHIRRKASCSWNSGAGIEAVQNNAATVGTAAPGRNYPGTWTVTVPDGRRFTPNSSFSTYTCDTIPYAGVIDSSATLYWYQGSTLLGSGPSITVTPSVPTMYTVRAVSCGDTSTDNVLVTIGNGPVITGFDHTNPTVCGLCNGTITIHGMVPGESDTVRYYKDGVLQPRVVYVPGADSNIYLTGLCAGVYDSFTVKANYCTSDPAGPVTLTNPSFTISSTSNTEPSVCGACDATITIYGLIPGYSDTIRFLRDGVPQTPVVFTVPASGIVTLTGLCAGTYTGITATMNTCTTPPVGPVVITNPPFGISDTTIIGANCSACDGSFTLYGLTPGQTITVNYRFNGVPQTPFVTTSTATGRVTLTNLCPGTYDNITARLNTCVSNNPGTIIITAPPLIPIAVINRANATECGRCNGSITIKGTPPGEIDTVFYTRNGVPQTPIITSSSPDSVLVMANLCEGDYDNIFIKSGPCPSTTITTSTILVDPPIVPGFTHNIDFGCNGDTVTFNNTSTSTGPLWFVWHFGDGYTDTIANPRHIYVSQGVYNVTLLATNRYCVDSVSVALNLVHPISASFTPIDTVTCQATPITFNNTSIGTGSSYLWLFGDGTSSTVVNPTHTFTNVGTYTVQLINTDFVPCSDTATTKVFVDSQTVMTVFSTDTTICRGTYMTFDAAFTNIGLTGTLWNFGNGDSIKDVNPVLYAYPSPGNFVVSLTATYRACGTVTQTRYVNVLQQPQVSLGANKSICEGSETITLADNVNAGNPMASWEWNTGSTTSSILVNTAGTYYVKVSINNCTAIDTVLIANDCYMAVPNIFTPNKDGVNDYFYPRELLSRGLTAFKMEIYNRWGQIVFETKNVDGRGWDGRFNDIDQPEGVYVFFIEGTFKDGRKESRKGNITLMR